MSVTPLPERPGGRPANVARYRRAAGAISPATERAYAAAWRAFAAWLRARGIAVERADDAALAWHLADMADAGAAFASIRKRASAIQRELPAVRQGNEAREVLAGIRRELADREARKARPVTAAMLRRLTAAMGDAPRDMRDRALVLVAFGAGLRRSEAGRLAWRDYADAGDLRGATLTLRRSKHRDAPATGELEAAADPAICPIRALAAWRAICPDTAPAAPMFPSARSARTGRGLSEERIRQILAERLAAAGLPTNGYSPHSLRAGAISEALARGAGSVRVRDFARHKSVLTTEGYARELRALAPHPLAGLR